jgi:ribonuclease P protein component
VYHKATKSWHTPYFVIFYKKSEEESVGFVASKKIGNAVKRNRAKRLLRAHFIEHYSFLHKGNYVFVAKKALLDESYVKLKTTFQYALKRVHGG